MNANAGHDGQQDRCRQQDPAGIVHQHADDYHENIHHQQNQVFVVRDAQQRGGNLRGDILHCQQLAENHHHEEHDHNDAGRAARFGQRLTQAVALEALIDEHAAGDGVGHADRGRLGGCHHAAVNAAQDDNRHNHRRDGAQGRLYGVPPPFRGRLRRGADDVKPPAHHRVHQAEQGDQNQAGDNRRRKAGEH